jgi:hypothetical protein
MFRITVLLNQHISTIAACFICLPCSASGQSSQEKKKGLISKLLVASKGCEPGYIMRSLQVGGSLTRCAACIAWLRVCFWVTSCE